ncbi:hypothetical protein [Sulfobacillus thermosulfidooxidans]|uniref:hypothetical protein n=1 Tax=Sulfobacillus thermosulfidooxidans TaxID=28034 RepID=UPI0006B51B90|nr:hypothetical protein [Sulfobacillus thermosulfidooxidans]
MAWICRITDTVAREAQETAFRTPMAVVQMAERVQLWPETLQIPGAMLPTVPEVRDQWEKACRVLATHGTQVLLEDTPWDPETPLRLAWPVGNPMLWPLDTPGAWDADTLCLTGDVGAVWWARQTGTGPWVLGVVHTPDDWEGAPQDVARALAALLPPDAARVRVDHHEWWCAWRRTTDSLSGAEWQRQMWATLGPVAVGSSLVTGDPTTWERAWRQAKNAKSSAPTSRVKGLSPEAAHVVREATRTRMDAIAQEQAARQRDLEAQEAAKRRAEEAAAQAAAEEARLQAEKWELERALENLRKQELAAAQARVEQSAHEVAALRQHIWEVSHRLPEASTPLEASDHSLSDHPSEPVPDSATGQLVETPGMCDAGDASFDAAASARQGEVPVSTPSVNGTPDGLSGAVGADGAERLEPSSPRVVKEPTDDSVKVVEGLGVSPETPEIPSEDSDLVNEEASPESGAASPTGDDLGNPALPLPRVIPTPWRRSAPHHWDHTAPVAPPRRVRPVTEASPAADSRLTPPTVSESPSRGTPPEPPPSIPPSRPRGASGLSAPESPPSHLTTFRGAFAGRASPTPVSRASTEPLRYWVWSDKRRGGSTTTAVALARSLAARGQMVLVLDGHLQHPGLLKVFFPGGTPPIRPGLGWDAQWIAGQPWCAPPQVVQRDTLTLWAMALPVKIPREADRWRTLWQRLPLDTIIVVDGGIMPPPVGDCWPICVVSGLMRPPVPQGTILAWRHASGAPGIGDVMLPDEPLGWEGVGGPEWQAIEWPGSAGEATMAWGHPTPSS